MKFSSKSFLTTITASIIVSISQSCAIHTGLEDPIVQEDTPVTKILSCDGGGIRGRLSLEFLRAVQDRVGGAVSVEQAFDVYAGTSTGAIISTGFASDISITQGIGLFETRGADIFQPRYSGWLGFWGYVDQLWNERYTAEGIEGVLQEVLGDRTLGSLDKQVILTSCDIEGGPEGKPGPYHFNSVLDEFQEVPVWQAVRASTAAPSYLPGFHYGDHHTLVDGGLVANCPAMVGITGFLSTKPKAERHLYLPGIQMLSIGTGGFDQPIPRQKGLGIAELAAPISGILMENAAQEALNQACDLVNVVRLDTDLPRAVELDDYSPETLALLRDSALAYIRDNPEEIERAANLVLR